tara:strand:+ start:374 stop:1153 length:780 start_codon:yes stop_codon:yes gene_type:complete
MECKICNNTSEMFHKNKILNKYNISYFQCPSCGFVQTEEPYWLNESYNEAISLSDTGIMARNIVFTKLATIVLSMLLDKNGEFLDYGGGYGIFTRLMRDNGFNYFWHDKHAENLVARGFEGKIRNKKYDGITSFENFEHFENPLKEIERIFSLTDFVLFSTDLISVPAPKTEKWWYYCLEHGQHVSLFSNKSLQYIANKYNYNFISNGTNIHIFSKKKITSKIFFITKIITKIGLDKFFIQSSKIDSDMNEMIDKMKDL